MIKKRLKKDEYAILTPYSDRLITAYKADYSRAIPTHILKQMKEIYERLTGDTSVNISCSKCVLRMLKKLYEFYNEKTTEIDAKQLEPVASDTLK